MASGIVVRAGRQTSTQTAAGEEGFANKQGLRNFLRGECEADGSPSRLLLAVMAWIWMRGRASRPLEKRDLDMLECRLIGMRFWKCTEA